MNPRAEHFAQTPGSAQVTEFPNPVNESFMPAVASALKDLHSTLEGLLERRDRSFIFKAPAGSGKSMALVYCLKVLKDKAEKERLKTQDKSTFHRTGQSLYTFESYFPHTLCLVPSESFVKGYSEYLGKSSSIHILTLEALAWELLSPFKRVLLDYVTSQEWKLSGQLTENDGSAIINIAYSEKLPALKEGTLHLSRFEVKKLFSLLLKDSRYLRKFTCYFKLRYATVMVDEYQIFPADILKPLLNLTLKERNAPQDVLWGLFGDPWQNVDLKRATCHDLDDPRLWPVSFDYNLRSAPRIVKALNRLRPENTQLSALNAPSGHILVVNCRDFKGKREHTATTKGALPETELQQRLPKVKSLFAKAIGSDKITVLMLTKPQIARSMGFDVLQMRLKGQHLEDIEPHPLLSFCHEFIEPLYRALNPFDPAALFDLLKSKRLPINTRADKKRWRDLNALLTNSREGAECLRLLQFLCHFDLVTLPYAIETGLKKAKAYLDKHSLNIYTDEDIPTGLLPYLCPYTEISAYLEAFDPLSYVHSEFTTQGESYDNVLLVIDDVWNLYSYHKQLPRLHIPAAAQDLSLKRSLHLFYRSISRTRHNLCLLIASEFDYNFEKLFKTVLDPDLICTYPEFEKKIERLHARQVTEGRASPASLFTTAYLEEAAALAEPGDPDTYEVNHV